MADNSIITTGAKTNGEFTISYQKNGYGGVIPVIDGVPQPSLTFGYVSENDKQACMNLIAEALRAAKGNIFEARRYMMNAIQVAANNIKPDEAVDVDGTEVLIDYRAKKAYENASEIANLEDITCELPDEAVKAMLLDRVRLALEERQRDAEYGYLGEEDDDE